MNTFIRSRSTMALAWLALAAFSVPAAADGVPTPRATRHSAAKPAAAPMMVAARKPNDSGVTLRYQLETTPQAGKATTVVLQFDGVSHPDGATVRLAADAGLTLSPGASTLTLPTGKPTKATVSVVSEGEGLAYLNVFITQGSAVSAISIPIQAGRATPVLKSSGDIRATPDGDNIISMPAK